MDNVAGWKLMRGRGFGAVAWVSVWLAHGCYNPTYSNIECAVDDSCPSGLSCDPRDRVCKPEGAFGPPADAPSADAAPVDAPSGPDGRSGPCSFDALHVDICGLDTPTPGTLVIPSGLHVYNTESRTFTQGGVTLPVTQLVTQQPGDVEAVVWSVDGLDVQAGATLRLVGTRPLIIGSQQAITVSGTIDASSDRTSNTTADLGAGANSTDCVAAGTGANDFGGGGGGGGGGFQGAGGNGGPGDSNDFPDSIPPDGTSAGGAAGGVRSLPAVVRGGCAGARGGLGGPGSDGLNGHGGGAVELASLVSISVPGTVDAGGSGGGGGREERGGGGGGGSGGWVGLDAPAVSVSGVVAANGGGGGEGGASNGEGDRGDNAEANEQRAAGGDGGGGSSQLGDGAAGSGGTDLDGVPATDFRESGGGGGGGGAGFIVVRTDTFTLDGTASPPVTPLTP